MADEKGKSTEDLSLEDFLQQENIVLTDKNLSEDKKKLIASKYSVSDLIKFSSAASGSGKEKIKSNILSILEIKDQMSSDALEKVQQEKAGLEEVKKRKEEHERKKGEDIDALKKLLAYDDNDSMNKNNDNNEIVETLFEAISMNEKNKDVLEEIKKLQAEKEQAQKDNKSEEVVRLTEELDKKKGELKGLLGQKDDLYYKYFRKKEEWEIYDDNGGKGIENFRRWGPILCNGDKLEGGGKVAFGVRSPLKHKHIARTRLNHIIQEMNEIRDDSQKGMEMVMNRCYLNGIRPLRRGMKGVSNTFRLKDPKKFGEKYEQQADKFIRNLIKDIKTANGGNDIDDKDRKTIELIEKRLKRYKSDYKYKFLQM